MTSLKFRSGFTLVELLVTIAIIGILMGLLLPAIQSVREEARVISCKNNLRNLGIAAQNYLSQHQRFPTAGAQYFSVWTVSVVPHRFSELGEPGSWKFQLLPFLEQQAAFSLPRQALGTSWRGYISAWPSDPTDPQSALDDAVIPVFICPTRGVRRASVAEAAATVANYDSPIPSLDWVCGDYAAPAGVAFVGAIPADRSIPYPDMFQPGGPDGWAAADFNASVMQANFWSGIIKSAGKATEMGRTFKYSKVNSSRVRDGLSNTVLAMEKSVDGFAGDNMRSTEARLLQGEALGIYCPDIATNMRMIIAPIDGSVLVSDYNNSRFVFNRKATSLAGQQLELRETGFGTAHPSGVTSVWGDGSVRTIPFEVSQVAFYDLCDRAGGFALQSDSLGF